MQFSDVSSSNKLGHIGDDDMHDDIESKTCLIISKADNHQAIFFLNSAATGSASGQITTATHFEWLQNEKPLTNWTEFCKLRK